MDRRVTLLVAGLSLAGPLWAHPHTYVDQQVHLSVGLDKTEAKVVIVPSVSNDAAILSHLDIDGNGTVDQPEADVFTAEVLSAMSLIVGGIAVPFTATGLKLSQPEALSSGTGRIELSATAALGALPAGQHSVRFTMGYDALAHDWFVQPFYFGDLTAVAAPGLIRSEDGSSVEITYATAN